MSTIKSVQPFSISLAIGTTGATAIISAVSTTKSYIENNGQNDDTVSADPRDYLTTLVLTNATTVTATRSRSNTTAVTIKGTVVEYS